MDVFTPVQASTNEPAGISDHHKLKPSPEDRSELVALQKVALVLLHHILGCRPCTRHSQMGYDSLRGRSGARQAQHKDIDVDRCLPHRRAHQSFPVRVKNGSSSRRVSWPLHLQLRKEPAAPVRTAGTRSSAHSGMTSACSASCAQASEGACGITGARTTVRMT
jgi:hypothetical protein